MNLTLVVAVVLNVAVPMCSGRIKRKGYVIYEEHRV